MNMSPEEIDEMKSKSDEMMIQHGKIHINFEKVFGKGVSSTVFKGHLIGPSPLHEQQKTVQTQKFIDCDVAVKVTNKFEQTEVEQLFKEIDAMKKMGYHENQKKASEIAKIRGEKVFKANSGWMTNVKKRKEFIVHKTSGEAASLNDEKLEHCQKTELRPMLKKYEPDNVYNADETALYLKVLADKTLDFKEIFSVYTPGNFQLDMLISDRLDCCHPLAAKNMQQT
uniref:HTH CENPB-type domain-containing protein n=1 Tax=Acrobeloides nanus TaxID=290746 RepID=A0A914D0S9_9BILA